MTVIVGFLSYISVRFIKKGIFQNQNVNNGKDRQASSPK